MRATRVPIWWNEHWMGWPLAPHYEASSNMVNAHKLEGKLLLVVGERGDMAMFVGLFPA